ncbi:MAG: SH3 domain-containing protein [Christensenellales bacterium]|jgi:hypothetical protein
MRKIMSIILATVLVLLLVPTATAQAQGELKLTDSSSWVNVPSGADISSERDANGNYTIKIAAPFRTVSMIYQGVKPGGYFERAFYLPIIPGNTDPVFVDGVNRMHNGEYAIRFVPKEGGNTESFSVLNYGSGYFTVAVEYYDAKTLPENTSLYPGYPGWYPQYDGAYYCSGCGEYVYPYSSYYSNGYYYLVCHNGHTTSSTYAGGFYPANNYLQVMGVVAYGDMYKNVSASNVGSQINLLIDTKALNANNDFIRIRVKPTNTLGYYYPAGTVVTPVAPTNSAHLSGSDMALDSSGSYSYILDKDGAFYITLTGIKNLASSNLGTWGSVSFKIGSSSSLETQIRYSFTSSTAAAPTPDASAGIGIKVGQSLALNYKVGSDFAPVDKVSWAVVGSAGTGSISISGNTITGLAAGDVYLKAEYSGSSTVVKIIVTADGGSVVTGNNVYTVKPNALNVRSGPGTGYSILGVLRKGDAIVGEGLTNGWMKITYNGQTAYVAGNQITK